MTDEQTRRYVEILFYYKIHRMYKHFDATEVLESFIEMFSRPYKYNMLIIQTAALKVLTHPSCRPSREETALLFWAAGERITDITAHTSWTAGKIKALVEGYRTDPFPFRFCFTPEVEPELHKFLDALKDIEDAIGGI